MMNTVRTDSLFDTVIAVTNRRLCDRPFTEQLERVCSHHPRALILREKDLPENEYELLAKMYWKSAVPMMSPAFSIPIPQSPADWDVPASICLCRF